MSYQIPFSTPSLDQLAQAQHNVVTASQLRARGVPARTVTEHCRHGGPWQRILPRVFLLQPGTPTPEQRLWAALLYAAQNGLVGRRGAPALTGAAALALYGFASVPRLPAVSGVDVLVPAQRRLRDAGEVRIVRTDRSLESRLVRGLACAPMARAVADALAAPTGPGAARELLREAVVDRGCPVRELVGELRAAGLLEVAPVRAALDEVLTAAREGARQRLADLLDTWLLPAPEFGPELRMRGGTFVALPDAFWPEQAVALELDSDARCVSEGESAWVRGCQHRMEYLGVRVVYLASERLEAEPEAVEREVREALAAGGVDPVPLMVLPG
ncbi:hypothetical protein [Peterkaempfera bronchialis]|uniref:hypothetical protein n=1 Tax=Peterkaempfera bronchialis TaxID=2126346 RepID=UPI0013B3728B|nr:hypothetical protein [Peterkaempfera bronchialis]